MPETHAPIVLPCLSITAAWAFFVCAGKAPKDVENRSWNTNHRGTFLIHVGKKLARADYDNACAYALWARVKKRDLPAYEALPLGGIVGAAELLDVLPPGSDDSTLDWYQQGAFGFVLGRRIALPFRALKGARQFFQVETTPTEASALRAAGLLP